MPTNYDNPGFEEEPDDQTSTIREAEKTQEEKPEYSPVLAQKSSFPGKELEVGKVVPMRITEIHDDEVVLVCEPDESEEEEPTEMGESDMGATPVEPPTSDFD